jgi:dihydroxy-acid dehydratase
MRLRSSEMREVSCQCPSLLGVGGISKADLSKPLILVLSNAGHSHAGSFHLDSLVEQAMIGVREAGGTPFKFTVTDVCDGVSMAHDGMNYVLASREYIANMIETYLQAHRFDGAVLISSCDKALPAAMIAAARLKDEIPVVIVPGGSSDIGPDYLMSGSIAPASARVAAGLLPSQELDYIQNHAIPCVGACQFMGTASTMQVMAESLGLAAPTSGLTPANGHFILENARKAGNIVMNLLNQGLKTRDIMTEKSFRNAVVIHQATGGSTNALLHLPAIAHAAGLAFDINLFDTLGQRVPYLTNIHTAGQYSSRQFWYAGGVQRVVSLLADSGLLEMDSLTVTGKTVAQNLADTSASDFFRAGEGSLGNYATIDGSRRVKREDVVRDPDDSHNSHGSVAILRGNMAPLGSVFKYSASDPAMYEHTGKAVVFDREEDAYRRIVAEDIEAGSVVVVRYEGPRGSGMPELYYTTAAIVGLEKYRQSICLVTDGRFSGATAGPVIGHVSPEASAGGPIALIEDGDLVEVSLSLRSLSLVGVRGQSRSAPEIANILAERRARWQPRPPRYDRGALGTYCRSATSAMEGAHM